MKKGIFISYRRAGNGAGFALSLYEGIKPVVGSDHVFFDVSHGAIDVGTSWLARVREVIGQCETLLVLVDDLFDRTINEQDDPLRIELELALDLGIRVIPVYVGTTRPPNKDQLPASLAVFPELQGSRIHLENSPSDMQQLIEDATGRRIQKQAKSSVSRLPVTGRDVFGRSDELQQLDEAWESSTVNILTIIAWGGVGKSTLINHWIHKLGSNFAGAERVYAWSFYSQGTDKKAPSGDVFVDVALSWFGDEDPTQGSAWEKGERLARLINSSRTLLLLDGLEPLQHPPGPQEGRLRDPSIQALLRELAVSNKGLCLISTRFPVKDLEEFEGISMERMDLGKLSPEAGAQLLRALDVRGDNSDLEKASSEFDGHSLALTLLGSYLGDVFDGDITRRHEIGPLETDVRYGGQARRVMESYEEWFGPGPEVDLLSVLGLFDRPAAPAALSTLRQLPVIPGLTDSLVKLSKIQWRQLLSRLRRARLLAVPDPEKPEHLDTHPLVREHYGQKLKDDNTSAWRQANSRLFEYYKSIAKEYPDTLEEMEPLFQSMICACRAGRETDALQDVYLQRIMRGDEYYAGYKLGSLSPLLAVLSQFFDDEEWTRPVLADPPLRQGLSTEDQLIVLTHAGWFLTATRSYAAPEVGEIFSFAETLCKDDKELFPVLRGLWVYKLVRAELVEAEHQAKQLLNIANQSGASGFLVEAHLAMGLTAVYKGEFESSRDHLHESLLLYDSQQHRLNSFMYGNDPGATALAFQGFTLWLLGYPDKAIAHCSEALELAHEVGHPFTTTLILYVYVMVYQACGDVANTKKYADLLMDFSARQGSTHFTTQAKVFSAWAQFWGAGDEGAMEKMLLGLKEHLSTGAIVTHTYHISLLAEALAQTGDYERGLTLLADGLNLVQIHGDRRWEADLYRVRGDLLASKPSPDPSGAMEAYTQSLKVAAQQASKSFELRTTIRLSQLLIKEGKTAVAREHLSKIYDWFSEGLGTRDLKDAAALLKELDREVPEFRISPQG